MFINKSFDSKLDNSTIDIELEDKLKQLYSEVGKDIEDGYPKDGINKIFDYIGLANKYFDTEQPWILAKDNKEKCNEVLFNCCNIIYNINTLLKPFLPFTSQKVKTYLNQNNNEWKYEQINNLRINNKIEPLYERYDKSLIDEELKLLNR